ncbi:MAG: hypothetical protein DI535_13120 [Citrobacter freundii]|nr:MAG: hypothetical protein DI535_13120 [Citrobacter freundii]
MTDHISEDFVFEKFKAGIEERGMRIASVESDGLINIFRGEVQLKVSLDNLRRNYERDGDENAITEFVKVVADVKMNAPGSWEQVKDQIYFSLLPLTALAGDPIYQPITMIFGKVYVYTGGNKLTWIDYSEMERWNISQKELEEQAGRNTDLLLREATIKYELIEGRKLGFIESDQPSLKTALLFAPSIREKIEPLFGFPFYAVLPVRDFCYIFSDADFDFFTQKIGGVVVEEYKKSGHPLSPEVIKFEEGGADAIGQYPVD